MGLQRSSEPFHRVYSAPEPPSDRWPRLIKPLAAVTALAAAGAVVFLVVPGQGQVHAGRDNAAVRPPGDSAEEPSRRFVRALPEPCGSVSKDTVDQAVPKATQRQSANSTLTTCTYASEGSRLRWLRVEARLYSPGDTGTPVQDAESYYATQWAQAHDTPFIRTISLARHRGIGDEAYRWFKADEERPAVLGQVTARIRNAVVTVSYSEQAPGAGGRDGRERACLDRATAAARDVLDALNDF
ncbi:hypothetical protein E1281_02790 [Actinomadura sp. KC345]|uniref:hypothetical protein n=1 Tax=Actinomadura sp. KC345 TaxID=2530371 RepID=UPI001046C58C|nr:hypothetical protein [Actinomadura sp. KC345]TDC58122.1 hypothetical protein E1281_02790 [Actinomadura sp. KC345]